MKKIILVLGLVYWMVLLSNSIPAQDRCEAPTLNVGDTWRYRDQGGKEWNRKVLSIEGDIYVISDRTYYGRQNLGYDKNTFNLDFIIEKDGRRTKFRGARGKVLDFPLLIGKKWSHLIRVLPKKGRGMAIEKNFREDLSVSAYEDVKVAAGTFKAFKIEYQNMDMGSTLQSARGAYWYSPEIKAVVKRTEEIGLAKGDWELVSYKLKQ